MAPATLRLLLAVLFMLLAISIPRSSAASRAQRYLGMCHYYNALSEELRCHRDDYLLRTAAPYCRRFDGLTERLSRQGAKVLAKIKICLQQSLERMPGLTCRGVHAVALRSHRGCYQEARFCRLGFFEQLEIIRIAAPMFGDAAYSRLGAEILGDCFDRSEARGALMGSMTARRPDSFQ